jgi:chromosome segregation ATPase
MGLGSTAKKLQKVADLAEDLVGRLNELRERVIRMEETVDETSNEVASLEDELAEQRAILEAVAEGEGVDVEQVIAGVETQESDDAPSTESDEHTRPSSTSATTQSDENA